MIIKNSLIVYIQLFSKIQYRKNIILVLTFIIYLKIIQLKYKEKKNQ